MTEQMLKAFLEACDIVKKIPKSMMTLPKDMKPRHIHIVDVIYQKSLSGESCRVSDVSNALKITTPSVTKLINELEALGVVLKKDDYSDKRSTLLELTKLGKEYEKKYVIDYHGEWINNLTDISDEQVATAISVIESIYNTMPKKE